MTRPFDPARPAHGPLVPFPLRVLVPFAAIGLAGMVAGYRGWTWLERILGVVGFHGGLLAASLAAAWEARRGWGPSAALMMLALLIAAAACTLSPWGCLAYLLPPAALALLVYRRPELQRMGFAPGADWRTVALGGAVGCFLGIHLLLSASRTLGYPVRLSPPAPYLTGLAYDVGANVLSAEAFFRGTLFNRWQRRWGFWTGALAATGLSVVRYLADPALPRTVEVVLGAVFYLALLSLSGCGLLWYCGSLGPALAASVVFFSAYRMLQVR
ncbi:MAG: hypothetical protein HY725_03560 [Candidatus Rokubacteria bacterium]|nr:hypothetical protein [Candidatus Rokubacteria bacterium]